MFYCEKCGDTDCCERTGLLGEPVLCDKCHEKAVRLQFRIFQICIIFSGLLIGYLTVVSWR